MADEKLSTFETTFTESSETFNTTFDSGTVTGGYVYTPFVSDQGVISWTNNGGLDNPASKNIMGPTGATGETGPAGANGKDGKDGEDGATGMPGTDGSNGTDGSDGADGKSHFDIFVEQGLGTTMEEYQMYYKGDPLEWDDLTQEQKDSLVGPAGATGNTGATGADGFSPTITVITNTDTEYVLEITEAGKVIVTPNLMGPKGDTGGTTGGAISTIKVNGVEQPITDGIVNLLISSSGTSQITCPVTPDENGYVDLADLLTACGDPVTWEMLDNTCLLYMTQKDEALQDTIVGFASIIAYNKTSDTAGTIQLKVTYVATKEEAGSGSGDVTVYSNEFEVISDVFDVAVGTATVVPLLDDVDESYFNTPMIATTDGTSVAWLNLIIMDGEYYARNISSELNITGAYLVAKRNQSVQGLQGEQGETGPAGADGQDGADGVDGQDGRDGTDGGFYSFSIEDGNLILSYATEEEPDFEIVDGNLIVNF